MNAVVRPGRLLLVCVALLSGLLIASGAGAGARAKPKQQRRPNIVVVMTDDQTVESLRVMTNVRKLLAQPGTTFTNSFVNYSLCCPSRSTFLTGQYAHNHGVLGNAPPAGGYDKLEPTHANTLPAWLQRGGYRTVHIGKYLNGYTADDGVPPGWSEWYGSVDPTTYRFYGFTLNENGRLVTYADAPFLYSTDVYTAKAVEAIRRLAPRRQPFFLSVAYLAPHSGAPRESDDPPGQSTPAPAPRHRNRFDSEPLPKPASFNEADVTDKPQATRSRPLLTSDRIAAIEENYQQRLESLLAVDEGIARIVAALRASHELSRTLIFFTSDNGFFHGEHRIPGGKVLLYEPSIRVPLILRGPGVKARRTSSALVANVDLAPTILDAANVAPGRLQDGISLLPIAAGGAGAPSRTILIERGPDARRAAFFTAVRTARYLYAEYGNGEQELYDVATDPDELQSRHADPAYAAVKAELAAKLAALRTCAGATCRPSS